MKYNFMFFAKQYVINGDIVTLLLFVYLMKNRSLYIKFQAYDWTRIFLCTNCCFLRIRHFDLKYGNLLRYFRSLLRLTVPYLKEISVTYSHVQLEL